MKGKQTQKSGIFEEARIFHLKFWQTPSFLFLIMGIVTIAITYGTYIVASSTEDPVILIISVSSVSAVMFAIGTLLVKVISKIIIINNARSEFLSLVSHQLRSPLTGTKYILQLILSEKAGELSVDQKELLEQSLYSSEQMLLLVNDLLDIARMADGDRPNNYKSVQIEKTISSVHDGLTPQAQKKKISLNIHLPAHTLPNVFCDEKKIRFVIQNLVDNAIKYTPSGGTVTISGSYNATKHEIEISVQDTGIGIPEENRNKLFTKFYRAENAEKTQKVGTGLGLYIAKNIIDRHRGRIWFESRVNRGSTFSFTLPAQRKR